MRLNWDRSDKLNLVLFLFTEGYDPEARTDTDGNSRTGIQALEERYGGFKGEELVEKPGVAICVVSCR